MGPCALSSRKPLTRNDHSCFLAAVSTCLGLPQGQTASPSLARRSRKSHCGMSAMNLQRVGSREKSARSSETSPKLRLEQEAPAHAAVKAAHRARRARASLRASTDEWCRRGNPGGSPHASPARRRRRPSARAGGRASCRRGRRRRCSNALRSCAARCLSSRS
jgi:hypothetical protein